MLLSEEEEEEEEVSVDRRSSWTNLLIWRLFSFSSSNSAPDGSGRL